ncbi:MAG: flagellar assembly protein FliW [Thermodesulfobacteriota bacterium]
MTENIKIETTRFGTVEVPGDKVIKFQEGIPGFEGLKSYVLLDHDSEGLFKWMQSVDDPDIAFLLTLPDVFIPGFALPKKGVQTASIGLKESEEPVLMVMVCVPVGEADFITLNLKGPIVFNDNNMSAMQCIVDNDDFPCDYKVSISRESAEASTEASQNL